LIGAALVAGTLSGCEGGFDLGSMFGGGQQQAAPSEGAPKKPRRRRAPAKQAPKKDVVAAAGTGAASPSPAPVLKPRSFLLRNVSYDLMRTRAMRLVYEGKTKKALSTFQSAQRLRPGDPAVEMWVSAIRQSAQKARDSAPKAVDDFNNAAQQLRTPALPGNGPAAAAPATTSGGAPDLPRPALPAAGNGNVGTTTTVDPRLVF
jgi:hypothetical protein